jgi:N-methylhydantoinase A
VLVPRAAGVLSALGLAVSDLRRDYVAAFLAELDVLDRRRIGAAFAELEARAAAGLDAPRLQRLADLRYRGQSFELTVPADDLDALAGRFAAAHRRRYGFDLPGEPVEVVSVRVTATVAVPKPRPAAAPPAPGGAAPASRPVHVDGAWQQAQVLRPGQLAPGVSLEGPAVVEFLESTCLVRPGWRAAFDDAGALVLERT